MNYQTQRKRRHLNTIRMGTNGTHRSLLPPPVWVPGVRIDPLRLLAGCRKRRLNQAPLNIRAWLHPNGDDDLE